MKAVCLLLVLLTAKGLSLAGRGLDGSAWAPLAYVWQDLAVSLLFAAADRFLLRRPWMGWVCYGAISAYAALNVAVVQTLSTPLTLPLLQAAGGPLSDSIRHHLDAPNLLRIGAVLVVAALGPVALRRLGDVRVPRPAWLAALAAMGLGAIGAARVDTAGLHRNALMALWPARLPRAEGPPCPTGWRASPFATSRAEDLSRFRGTAAGRNVVIIALESTGARHLQPWGAAHDPMPNLTALTRGAIRFDNAYCVYPESIKGFFSLLCSRFPGFGIEAERYAAVRTPSLADVLAGGGYRTALFHSGRFMYLGMEETLRDRGFDILEDAGAIGGNHQSSFGVDEPATVQRILSWIDGLEPDDRFMVTYLPIAGHHPYATPEPGPFPESTELDRYRNALHYGDQALGRLLEGLRERGLDTNTLFVIYGDHGEAFGDHDGNHGHTLFLYESNVHVPLLFAAPGLPDHALSVRRTASLIDVAPTLLDWLGLAVPDEFQGASLLEGPDRMALFFTDYSLGLLGLRDGPWKFIHELDSGRSRLFDLKADPAELQNLAARHPERVRLYRARLRDWAAAQRTERLAEMRP